MWKLIAAMFLVLVLSLPVAAVELSEVQSVQEGIGAVSPYGIVTGVDRLDRFTQFIFTLDARSDSIIYILLDNNGDLDYSLLGFCYFFFDVYSTYTDVYGSRPGEGWRKVMTLR